MDRYSCNIKKARENIFKALKAIKKCNSNGRQYDMTTNVISTDLDIVTSYIKEINKIYYQQ